MRLTGLYFVMMVLFAGCKPSLDYSKWDKGIGTFTVLGGGKGVSSKVQYVYNNKTYEGFGYESTYVYGMVYNEKYEIRIDPQNPTDFFVLAWLPLFTKDEKTSFTTAKITRVFKYRWFSSNPLVSKYAVEFVYTVDGIEIERSQHLPPGCDNYCNIRNGETYELEFWHDNVYRSKLHIDKPIK